MGPAAAAEANPNGTCLDMLLSRMEVLNSELVD